MFSSKKIEFLSDGQRIVGTLFIPENIKEKKPGAVFFHGMTSSEKNYIPISEKLAGQGIVTLTLSTRGHGESEGDFNSLTVNDAVKDGLAAYDFMAQQDFIDAGRIGLCGASVGAAISAIVAAQRRVKSLIVRVPAAYSTEMMEMTYTQIMASEGKIFNDLKEIAKTPALLAISKFDGALLVVSSGKDAIIPSAIPHHYFSDAIKAARKEEREMTDATHGLIKDEWRTEFTSMVVSWFTETL
jgi:hypothetical protein